MSYCTIVRSKTFCPSTAKGSWVGVVAILLHDPTWIFPALNQHYGRSHGARSELRKTKRGNMTQNTDAMLESKSSSRGYCSIESVASSWSSSRSSPTCSSCSAISRSSFVVGRALAARSRVFAHHSSIDSAGPPSILTGFISAGFPMMVPWYRESTPVLLCFFMRALVCKLVCSTLRLE